MSDASVTRRFKWDDIEVFPGNPLLERRLKQMTTRWGGFLPQIVGIPLVADNTAGAFPEYGSDAIVMVNGHHRQALAKQHGHGQDEVICEFLRGQTREVLHERFRQTNDFRQINHAELFMHRVGQREAKAVEIMEVLEREGYKPSTFLIIDPTTIHSTSSLEWIWDGGDRFLRKRRGKGPHRGTLTLTLNAYRTLTSGKAIKAESALLKGLGAFFLRYPESDSGRLTDRLTQKYDSAGRLLDSAKQAKEDFRLRNAYEAFGFVARMTYNGSRGGKHSLPEWRA